MGQVVGVSLSLSRSTWEPTCLGTAWRNVNTTRTQEWQDWRYLVSIGDIHHSYHRTTYVLCIVLYTVSVRNSACVGVGTVHCTVIGSTRWIWLNYLSSYNFFQNYQCQIYVFIFKTTISYKFVLYKSNTYTWIKGLLRKLLVSYLSYHSSWLPRSTMNIMDTYRYL